MSVVCTKTEVSQFLTMQTTSQKHWWKQVPQCCVGWDDFDR